MCLYVQDSDPPKTFESFRGECSQYLKFGLSSPCQPGKAEGKRGDIIVEAWASKLLFRKLILGSKEIFMSMTTRCSCQGGL